MARPAKTAQTTTFSDETLAALSKPSKFKTALTSPITAEEQQTDYKAKPPVAEDITLSVQNQPGISTHKPDLLGHPYHQYLHEHGLVGMFTTADMIDLRQQQGWRIFKRPANTEDAHPIFLGTEGDAVRRGELTLMVRPKAMQEAEVKRNAQAYKEEVAGLQDEMKESAKQVKSQAEGTLSISEAVFPQPKPVDELG